MNIIFNYSPFRNLEELYQQFNLIKKNGTLVILFNMRTSSVNDKPELDIVSDPHEIFLSTAEVDWYIFDVAIAVLLILFDLKMHFYFKSYC